MSEEAIRDRFMIAPCEVAVFGTVEPMLWWRSNQDEPGGRTRRCDRPRPRRCFLTPNPGV